MDLFSPMMLACDRGLGALVGAVLDAPEGEVGWTLIELQGSIEARSDAMSLDGVEFGTLVQEVGRTLASRAAALCTPLQAPSHDALRNPRARVGAGGCAA